MSKSFQATLEHMASRLNWVYVAIPFDVAKVWKTRGQLKVKGTINGFAFRTSLFAKGDGTHYLLVNNRMQKAAKVTPGSTAKFQIEPDTEVRTVSVAPELMEILSEEKALLRWYGKFSYSMRNYISQWIVEVKSPEARRRRAEQIAERLMATMEAERDLPPAIRGALMRDPRAMEGWKKMSEARRRGHLMGIFYYREPASQARRLAKAVKDAYELYERAAGKKSQTGASST